MPMSSRAVLLLSQRGAGLLEILITLLLVTIGILGFASLQMSALKQSQSAMDRSLVVSQVYSMIDMMRSDSQTQDYSVYNIALSAATPSGNSYPVQAIEAWRRNLSTQLNGAQGQIACSAARACQITIQWDDSRAGRSESESKALAVSQFSVDITL
ncbi:type IV pilus modification protein PilV [Nitrincola tibetensis]|uniref:Type IV pilus modification protein PilV n=1 Tax=Nitrincola tibetensis TaxID=2219697 RepID=A0A364NJI0_9GAMM|nr:type IV pilus modification protein PilV [Nitrincola tibetensis]RAU17223.1 type IV pilus modification protein PilV [Nitrincola tibetensis]